jgi:hypothetical protein
MRTYPSHLCQALAWVSLLAFSSCAHQNVKRDIDRTPEVNTGVGAAIIYPGQAAPRLPGPPPGYPGAPTPATPAPEAGGPARAPAPAPGAGAPTPGSANRTLPRGPTGPSTGGVTFIGGARVEERQHQEIHQEPTFLKVIKAPFAVVAWPVKKAYEAVRPEPEPDPPPLRRAAPRAPTRHQVQAAREQDQVDRMRSELQQRGAGAPPAPSTTAGSTPTPEATPPSSSARMSIADELAALRRARTSGRAASTAAEALPSRSPAGLPDLVLDRDGNGRPDHWVYREHGRPVRELFDDDGDGVPNRTIILDPVTGQRVRLEEDADGDGRIDSWSEYEEGSPVRRRADSDGSGFVDTWTFYREGAPFRHEQDTNGDGFRNRVGHYENGQLVREEEDVDGDGHPDRVTRFDPKGEVAEVDEDANGNGVIDRRSFYENGRLVRRELLTDAGVADGS